MGAANRTVLAWIGGAVMDPLRSQRKCCCEYQEKRTALGF
jgi:hypothetical protein